MIHISVSVSIGEYRRIQSDSRSYRWECATRNAS